MCLVIEESMADQKHCKILTLVILRVDRNKICINNFVFLKNIYMRCLSWPLLLVIIFFSQVGDAQKLKKSDQLTLTNLENHIHYLADDKLEGRRAGTRGEELAMDYISDQFKQIGLRPKGTVGYYQDFTISEGKQINAGTHFIINDKELKTDDDYFPFPYSPNVNIEALPAIGMQETGMPWFIDLKDAIEENAGNPHFDLNTYIREQAIELKKKGATALIMYNTSTKEDQLKFDAKDKSEVIAIPVIYVKKETAKKYFSDASASLDIKLKTDIGEKKRTGHNVIGYIDNG